MPRRTRVRTTSKRSSAPEGDRAPRRQRTSNADVDVQVLRLREAGSSFSEIARRLELARAMDAHKSFVRALGSYGDDDRRKAVDREVARLDLLEERIRERDAADPEKVQRRLLGVERLREAIR